MGKARIKRIILMIIRRILVCVFFFFLMVLLDKYECAKRANLSSTSSDTLRFLNLPDSRCIRGFDGGRTNRIDARNALRREPVHHVYRIR
jgi:hypothetical protein